MKTKQVVEVTTLNERTVFPWWKTSATSIYNLESHTYIIKYFLITISSNSIHLSQCINCLLSLFYNNSSSHQAHARCYCKLCHLIITKTPLRQKLLNYFDEKADSKSRPVLQTIEWWDWGFLPRLSVQRMQSCGDSKLSHTWNRVKVQNLGFPNLGNMCYSALTTWCVQESHWTGIDLHFFPEMFAVFVFILKNIKKIKPINSNIVQSGFVRSFIYKESHEIHCSTLLYKALC